MYKETLQQNQDLTKLKGSLSTEQLFGLTMRFRNFIRRVRTILKKTDDSDLEFLRCNKDCRQRKIIKVCYF